MIIMAPASPKTNPSRSLSNGREGRSRLVVAGRHRAHHRERRDRQRLDPPSTPPQTAKSASPMTI
jgi:hypothetical protein